MPRPEDVLKCRTQDTRFADICACQKRTCPFDVPARHRHRVVLFHQRSSDFDIVMTNDVCRERYGKDNPNIALIYALKQAGVEFRGSSVPVGRRSVPARSTQSRSIPTCRSTCGP